MGDVALDGHIAGVLMPAQYARERILGDRTMLRRTMRRDERDPAHPLQGIASPPLDLLHPEEPSELLARFGWPQLMAIIFGQNLIEACAHALCWLYELQGVTWEDTKTIRIIRWLGAESSPADTLRISHVHLAVDPAIAYLLPRIVESVDATGQRLYGALAPLDALPDEQRDAIARVRASRKYQP